MKKTFFILTLFLTLIATSCVSTQDIESETTYENGVWYTKYPLTKPESKDFYTGQMSVFDFGFEVHIYTNSYHDEEERKSCPEFTSGLNDEMAKKYINDHPEKAKRFIELFDKSNLEYRDPDASRKMPVKAKRGITDKEFAEMYTLFGEIVGFESATKKTQIRFDDKFLRSKGALGHQNGYVITLMENEINFAIYIHELYHTLGYTHRAATDRIYGDIINTLWDNDRVADRVVDYARNVAWLCKN